MALCKKLAVKMVQTTVKMGGQLSHSQVVTESTHQSSHDFRQDKFIYICLL